MSNLSTQGSTVKLTETMERTVVFVRAGRYPRSTWRPKEADD